MRNLVLCFLAIAIVVGCGGTTSPASSGGTTDGGTTADGGGGGDSSTTGPTAATTGIGPIPLGAGEEKTVCINKRLDNTDDIVGTSFVTDLAPGSHHLIVYRSNVTTEELTPYPCSPFEGLVMGVDKPFLIVTKSHLEYALPSGVGLQFAKGQMLKIEAHYINASSSPIMGSATVQIKGTSLASAGPFQPADVGVWGTLNISIPARATFQTPVSFQPGSAGMKVFGLTTHEHHLGTRMQVWSSAHAGDVSTPIADDKDWSNPVYKTFDPPLAFDGTTGMSYQCDYNNTTNATVTFGESALNEMCFVLFYYYPSHGVDECFDGRCMHR